MVTAGVFCEGGPSEGVRDAPPLNNPGLGLRYGTELCQVYHYREPWRPGSLVHDEQQAPGSRLQNLPAASCRGSSKPAPGYLALEEELEALDRQVRRPGRSSA
ncbi:MAG: hypothetical protein MZV64_09905 [Ignavibacteriales bacterium]|nr:hypothetical protein [Ignavibacteriales bacterium]